ncbi:DNA topoisomerase 2-binding protein 1 [Acropora cervicornis]|uniref:DNA topoisomerase 2-binding protein 1 n=1 Tax=Acropora cervicornis TaxID=6130 RepID=A0AAD9PT36_ACRCE|nr:DNA topoisomerase 2-binding protein 1 [Acropora cervicornis]
MAACTRKDRKKYRILLSSFTAEEKVKLSTLIQKLGGTYVDTPTFVRTCSHVICGKPNRGEKFLSGCASGRLVKVSFDHYPTPHHSTPPHTKPCTTPPH